MVSIRAIYENGKLLLLDPVELQDGQEVDITIVPKEVVYQSKTGKRKLELFRDLLEQDTAGRIPDLHPGAFQMSDDFDEPLPDSFWLGEDE